jgi:peptidoglycan/xylan/chitin deacetylase (PgdA/CDA1 family)
MIKRLIKLKVSILYFVFQKILDLLRISKNDQFNRRYQVILYHDFETDQSASFENQMRLIVNESHPLSVKSLENSQAAGNFVIVTFDDAIQSLLDTALPVLKQYGIPATIFVPTSYVGEKPEWDGWISTQGNGDLKKVMTVEQLNKLPENLITLGSHTRTHKNLTQVAENVACNEIKDSKTDLEKLVNKQIDYLAFPYGEYDEMVIRLSRESGYKRVFSALPSESDGFLEGRIDVSPLDWDIEFRLKILGYYRWMHSLSTFKRRVISLLKK